MQCLVFLLFGFVVISVKGTLPCSNMIHSVLVAIVSSTHTVAWDTPLPNVCVFGCVKHRHTKTKVTCIGYSICSSSILNRSINQQACNFAIQCVFVVFFWCSSQTFRTIIPKTELKVTAKKDCLYVTVIS